MPSTFPRHRPARRLSLARPATSRSPPVHPAGGSGALVKWFMPTKGYGFLEPEDGSADLFCHMTAVQASGRDTLPEGAAVTCEIVQGDRGPQVSSILSVEPGALPAGPYLLLEPHLGARRA